MSAKITMEDVLGHAKTATAHLGVLVILGRPWQMTGKHVKVS